VCASITATIMSFLVLTSYEARAPGMPPARPMSAIVAATALLVHENPAAAGDQPAALAPPGAPVGGCVL
jgi:hypothetical protein